MQDEEGTGIVILLHEVVALVDPAEAELVEEVLLHGAVLDEGGEGEMGGEALEDEGFVDKTFLLLDGCEVFVYLRFVAGKLDGKVFFILPAALHHLFSYLRFAIAGLPALRSQLQVHQRTQQSGLVSHPLNFYK